MFYFCIGESKTYFWLASVFYHWLALMVPHDVGKGALPPPLEIKIDNVVLEESA